MIAVVLAIAAMGSPPQLSTGIVETEPGKFVEIRADGEKSTDGVHVDFEWLVIDPRVGWNQYEGGRVFACAAPLEPGDYTVRLRIERIDWEKRTKAKDWRIYTIRVRGPPTPKPDIPTPTPDPTTPDSLTGPVYSIVIRKAAELTADQSTALLQIRTWVDNQSGEFQHLEFSPKAVNSDGSVNASVAAYVDKIPAGSEMPFVFIIQRYKTGGSFIHWLGELTSANEIIGKLEGAK